jgi:Uma2 family endonuclease
MSSPAHRRRRYTFEEYVRLEADSNVKHEFFDGEIYAMAGGTPEHAALAANAIGELSRVFRDRGCTVYSPDLRLRSLQTGLATYPDGSVVCGPLERDPADRNTVTNPLLVVEVTSPSSEDYDRGDKLMHYQTIPSLRACLIVSHRARRVSVFVRGEDGAFVESEVIERGDVEIAALECRVSLDEIYRGVLPPA